MNSICFHDLPHKNLRLHILQLHVTYCNYHDHDIVWVINMACHGSPTWNTSTMVKYQPYPLQISTQLRTWNKINPIPFTSWGHFEQVNFWETLTRENIVLDIVIRAIFFSSRMLSNGPCLQFPCRKADTRFWMLDEKNVKNLSIKPWRLTPCSFIAFISLKINNWGWLVHEREVWAWSFEVGT